MKISLEAECLPLFVAGVLLVVLAEGILAALFLKKDPGMQRKLLAHAVCLLAAFFCLGFLLFSRRMTPDGDVYNSSGLLSFFGLFWFAGECCAVSALLAARKEKRPGK